MMKKFLWKSFYEKDDGAPEIVEVAGDKIGNDTTGTTRVVYNIWAGTYR